jgi:hypothetical protein
MQESDVFGSSLSCGCFGKCEMNAINTSKIPLGHPCNMHLDIFKFIIIILNCSLLSYGLQGHLRDIKNQVCQLFMDYKNNYGVL